MHSHSTLPRHGIDDDADADDDPATISLMISPGFAPSAR